MLRSSSYPRTRSFPRDPSNMMISGQHLLQPEYYMLPCTLYLVASGMLSYHFCVSLQCGPSPTFPIQLLGPFLVLSSFQVCTSVFSLQLRIRGLFMLSEHTVLAPGESGPIKTPKVTRKLQNSVGLLCG